MTRLLVVSAHAADFVCRAGGAIATVTAGGGSAHVVALSYGERGESGELWKTPGQTEENVKRVRHEEAARAAAHLGATFEGVDLGDYPLVVDDAATRRLVDVMTSFAPDVLLTHAERDPFNPDHPWRTRRPSAPRVAPTTRAASAVARTSGTRRRSCA
jgi:4-oxalomesaconate hydratase